MFLDITQLTHNSEAPGFQRPRSAEGFSKLLVTRRSWQAAPTWAKLPTQREFRRASRSYRSDNASPVAWVGDLVDGIPLHATQPEQRDQTEAAKSGQTTTSTFVPDDPSLESTERKVLIEFLRMHGFRPYQVICFFFSVLTYISDVGSDAYLVYSYHKQGDYIWSYLTLILMLVPALIMTSFSLVWYILDLKVRADPPRTCRAWTLRLFFHGLQLAPLVRLADALYYGIASRRADVSLAMAVHYTQLMLYEGADSAMLRMIECFMEAAPQLLLQLYIIFTQEKHKQTFQILAQAVSCSTSWLSLAWCLTHYQSALRSSRVEKANLRWSGSACYFGWKAGMLASRLLSLALFAAVVHCLWFGLALGAHWCISFMWLIGRGTTFCSPDPHTLTEFLFDAVLGAVYCFDVVNVREGHSRLGYLIWYSLIGLENVCMTWMWSWLSSVTAAAAITQVNAGSVVLPEWLLRRTSLSPWIHALPAWVLPACVVGSFVTGIGLMVLYYLYAHPSGNIPIWIPFSELISFNDEKRHSTKLTTSATTDSGTLRKIDTDRLSATESLSQPCVI
ncbi:XK protein [Fasciola hepatica]|uniref:XK-related protein n=1 Tax=Fasciola hepatica TaxID=6192 RepID=A0A4E0R8A0_FASHE|nr:XK protein [Fasciola hepatica]